MFFEAQLQHQVLAAKTRGAAAGPLPWTREYLYAPQPATHEARSFLARG